MFDFDILAPNTYGAQPAQGSPGGFDILGSQGPNGRTFNAVPLAGQQPGALPQGAPMSGLLAGVLGLPTQGGAIPGAAYAVQGQAPGQMQAGQAPGVQPQGSGLAAALGMGARSLFDGVVGGGR